MSAPRPGRRRVDIAPFSLALRRPLATAHGVIRERRGLLVTLVDEQGRQGFGEATPLPDFGTEDLATCRAALDRAAAAWRDAEETGRADGATAADAASTTPCAAFAFDTARFDLAARGNARPLAAEVAAAFAAGRPGRVAETVATQALVGGATAGEVARRAAEARAAGFAAFKLKLAASPGRPDVEADLERVAALREAVGEGARLRLDANAAWSVAEARRALARLAPYGIDFVEQPVAAADVAGLAQLRAEGLVGVAADEALLGRGAESVLEAGAADVLILKPAAQGGLARSAHLAARARAAGVRVVWSTLIDGAVGRGAAIALAAGLGPDDETHGLGTADWLAADLVATPESIVEGRVDVSREPGLGFVPRRPGARSDEAIASGVDPERAATPE